MSLKAGRVGVNPDDVDPIDGHVKSSSTSGYTKQEADAKFETQTHAASTYETKSDAATLQPKTLAVPIEMLSGTKLTVETALQGLASDKTDDTCVDGTFSETVVTPVNTSYVRRFGKVVDVSLNLNDVTAVQSTPLARIPEGFRPSVANVTMFGTTTENDLVRCYVDSSGYVNLGVNITGKSLRLHGVYIID